MILYAFAVFGGIFMMLITAGIIFALIGLIQSDNERRKAEKNLLCTCYDKSAHFCPIHGLKVI